jgi:hypothetical protein
VFLEHAGLSAGRTAVGRSLLRSALAHGLAAYPWQAERAREALR